ncbi:hypothetical protein DFH06DRAFT_1130952 [Mycena polygramma]|nr:hypothetical protein DFH06DRAFT_1130952 [Mycena polygramma]
MIITARMLCCNRRQQPGAGHSSCGVGWLVRVDRVRQTTSSARLSVTRPKPRTKERIVERSGPTFWHHIGLPANLLMFPFDVSEQICFSFSNPLSLGTTDWKERKHTPSITILPPVPPMRSTAQETPSYSSAPYIGTNSWPLGLREPSRTVTKAPKAHKTFSRGEKTVWSSELEAALLEGKHWSMRCLAPHTHSSVRSRGLCV